MTESAWHGLSRPPLARRLCPRAAVLAALVTVVGAMGQAKVPDPLTEARDLYNQERYDDAIEKATAARDVPALADGAGVVLARAHLDRYRKSAETHDLLEARTELKAIDVTKLSADDRVSLAIARGESLYLDDSDAFDDRYSAAAEEFEIALTQAATLDDKNRDALFDWWAGSLDRQAQQGPEADRKLIYARILARAADEVALPNGSASASYWLPVSARGVDDSVARDWRRGRRLGPRGHDGQPRRHAPSGSRSADETGDSPGARPGTGDQRRSEARPCRAHRRVGTAEGEVVEPV